MTEGQVQGKCVLVRINGEFEITEFELAGFNFIMSSEKSSLSVYSWQITKTLFWGTVKVYRGHVRSHRLVVPKRR